MNSAIIIYIDHRYVHLLVFLINCILLINTQNTEPIKLTVTDLVNKLFPVQKRGAHFGLRKSEILERCIATEVSVFRVNLLNIRININISYKCVTSSHAGNQPTKFTPISFRINL
jgi:hypothetical protein